jgi:hypothetical protein
MADILLRYYSTIPSKYMKIIKALLILFVFAAPVMAQNSGVDVIYLKNGSVIRGSIFEQKPDEYIKIQSLDGNTYVYKPSEVEKITKEVNAVPITAEKKQAAPRIQKENATHYQAPKKGMWFAAETQFLNPPGMDFVLGYKLTDSLIWAVAQALTTIPVLYSAMVEPLAALLFPCTFATPAIFFVVMRRSPVTVLAAELLHFILWKEDTVLPGITLLFILPTL